MPYVSVMLCLLRRNRSHRPWYLHRYFLPLFILVLLCLIILHFAFRYNTVGTVTVCDVALGRVILRMMSARAKVSIQRRPRGVAILSFLSDILYERPAVALVFDVFRVNNSDTDEAARTGDGCKFGKRRLQVGRCWYWPSSHDTWLLKHGKSVRGRLRLGGGVGNEIWFWVCG
ncbi:hypothetical protein AA313_de0207022 [Arthrobotrys entomopaga]|nr:hypothetical protein AA313_de0207022 [Arthrobotrys entomopaga]